MPSAEIIEVTRKVHYHEHLAALGKLEALVVRCLDGYERRLVGFKNAKLCSNEQKNQLFVEGISAPRARAIGRRRARSDLRRAE